MFKTLISYFRLLKLNFLNFLFWRNFVSVTMANIVTFETLAWKQRVKL